MIWAFIGEALAWKAIDTIIELLVKWVKNTLDKNRNCLSEWDENVLKNIFEDFYYGKLQSWISESDLSLYEKISEWINTWKKVKIEEMIDSYIDTIIAWFSDYHEKVTNTICNLRKGTLTITSARWFIENDTSALKHQLNKINEMIRNQLLYIYTPLMQWEEMTQFVLYNINKVTQHTYDIDILSKNIISSFVPYQN